VRDGDGAGITSIAFSPDGKVLAAGQDDYRVILWDVPTWHELGAISFPRKGAQAERPWANDTLAFSPDGRYLVTSRYDDFTRLWEVATGTEVWHQREPGSAAFSPDGKLLVTAGWSDAALCLRDPATGQVRARIAVSQGNVDDIAFAPDGRTLATWQHDAAVRLFDTASGRLVRSLRCPHNVDGKLAFSPDGKWLLCADGEHGVRLVEVATGREALRLGGHEGGVCRVQFGPDGRTALTASADLTALRWSLRPAGLRPAARGEEALWADLRSAGAAAAYRAQWALLDDPQKAVRLLGGKLAPASGGDETAAARTGVTDTDGPTPDALRVVRAVQVMELCGTGPARVLLGQWAAAAPGALLTEQAREALARVR
jgi:dipeptidyl aminopeptidase/acylaminoacyl peptidase